MACSSPLKGFVVGKTESGKDKLRICSFHTAYVESGFKRIYDYKLIPCGRCVGCKLNYAREWSIRCCLEASFYDSNYFLTLTYDDNNNPHNLIKDDLRNFIKKLRTYLSRAGKPEIRFFACGEYGSQTLRPHFHLIVFNLVLDDLKYLKRSKTGYDLYESKFLTNIWSKGFVQVGECTIKTASYVARYCLKGINHSDISDYGFNKEFVLMSRRPGIGYGYFDLYKNNIYDTDKIYFSFGDFNSCSPPKYFDNLMSNLDPEIISQIKDIRRFKADMVFNLSYLKSGIYDELEYKKMVNDDKEKKINILRYRDYV